MRQSSFGRFAPRGLPAQEEGGSSRAGAAPDDATIS